MSFPVLSFPYECAISTDLTVRYQPVRVCDINRSHCAICSDQGVRYAPVYATSGTLFEGRFRAKAIQTKSHLLHLCRYIHGNPVKDGLAADPADWPYSNYLEWIGERDGTLVDRDFIENQFGNADEYKKFLFEYLNSRQLPDDVKKYLDDLEK